jgi:hypothetical protein
MGRSSLLVANVVPWGRVSGPAGLAPEALQERECSCRVFSRVFTSVRGICFNRHRRCSAGFGRARMTGTSCVRCSLGGVAVRRAPEPGPVRGDRGELSVLFQTRPRRPFAGRRVRFPQPPSIGSRIADSSSSCYRVVQVDAHAPFDLARGPETCPWKRLCGFARWGSVPFAGDRGRGNYPSMGSPRLAALAGS